MHRSPGDHPPQSLDQDSTWSNPSKMSRKVRELAIRSHEALKAAAQPDGTDLGMLRSQVVRLQEKIHARRLGVLIPWVDALRKRIEDRLGSPGIADPR